MASSSIQIGLDRLHDYYILLGIILTFIYLIVQQFVRPIFFSPLRTIPGPKLFVITRWRLALEDWKGSRTSFIHSLHQKYGPVVRVGPNEVSSNSLTALRTIYGAGSGFERTPFYRMFDVYGRPNLFTLATSEAHGKRKKLLNHAYSKSAILSGPATKIIEQNVSRYLQLLDKEPETASEIFTSLHYFSLDSISQFVYGVKDGGTEALIGDTQSRALLNDIIDPSRRKLSWFAVHLPKYTKYLYTRTGLLEMIVTNLGLLPMQKPATYSGIRAHALQAWTNFEKAADLKSSFATSETIMERLWSHSRSGKEPHIDGLDIASEAADHLLAGIDTTSDALLFLLWALSLPENKIYQQKLINELNDLEQSCWTEDGILPAEAADKLVYLDAIIKETLRLYAPLPASEPRLLPVDCTIDGHIVPAYTVVSISPYTLHRNSEVFPDPLKFKPERWLGELGDVTEMKKWFWAFSSGGRMCIGMHLAMAEMATLVAAIYHNYTTDVQKRQKGISPGIVSRFEIFYDETFPKMEEHTCWIQFKKRSF